MKLTTTIGLFLISVAMLGLSACGSDNGGNDHGDHGGDDHDHSKHIKTPDEFKDKKAPDGFKADLVKGKELYVSCAPCHGDKGQGVEALKGPSLAVDGISDDYMRFRIMAGADAEGKPDWSTMTGLPKGDASDEDYEKNVWNLIEYIKSMPRIK